MGLERVVRRFLFVCCVMAGGCVTPESPLQQVASEGHHILQTMRPGAGPDEKVRTAHELLLHAQKYEQLIFRSPGPDYTARAVRFQREEKETAAKLLSIAAEEYAQQKAVDRARAVYQVLLDRFDQDNERAIRRNALSALNRLQIE